MSRSIETRKLRHLDACLRPESQYQRVSTGLDSVPWPYRALPESNLEEVRLGTVFLGRRLKALAKRSALCRLAHYVYRKGLHVIRSRYINASPEQTWIEDSPYRVPQSPEVKKAWQMT